MVEEFDSQKVLQNILKDEFQSKMEGKEFDPQKAFLYAPEEVFWFIIKNKLSEQDLYDAGFPASKRSALKQLLDEWKKLLIGDDETWDLAKSKDTIPAYCFYLEKYDKSTGYRGKHVIEAKMRIEELKKERISLRQKLFDDMKKYPWKYEADTVRYLLDGVNDENTIASLKKMKDIASKFICSGQTVEFEELQSNGIVPNHWTYEKIIAPDAAVVQTEMRDLGKFPTEGRTDIFFLGIPAGGKSSVLAGLFYEMHRLGRSIYEPQFNEDRIDRSSSYYEGLIKSVDAAKFPVSTAKDTISFIKINLQTSRRVHPLTFVELSGAAFMTIAKAHAVKKDVWAALGAVQCLQSKNKKLLAFIVDYSIEKGSIRVDAMNNMDQSLILLGSLNVLCSDGDGPKGDVHCTFSRIDTVAVIVTKCDLMDKRLSEEERTQEAMNYLSVHYKAFMNTLTSYCKRYGVNAPNKNQPYVLTFSLGNIQIGNTYDYDPRDSAKLIDFISVTTEGRRR